MRNHDRRTQVVEAASDLVATSRKAARKGVTEARSFIERKPILSTAIGFAAGLLVSFLFRSRD
jgi:ElaB/YqjD/DUF883 family membrane-anchored ribosome-binding protein